MTRVMLKEGANIYRVIVDRPGRPKTHPYPCPPYTEIYGPYGTQGAATGNPVRDICDACWKAGVR